MIKHYYYNTQLKKFIIGFANVFNGLQVKTGKDECGEELFVTVPIKYGSVDRVVAAIGGSDTQNKQHTLPMMACYLTGIELAPERMHGVNQVDSRTMLEQGGVFPDDVKAIRRVVPIPYNMQMELSIHASNTDQMYQILEQVLMLFDYQMQLQYNDAPFDWTRIGTIELIGISNEEVYPMGVERRAIIWTLSFSVPVWLSPPAELRKDIINSVTVTLGNIDDLALDEIDADGNSVSFTDPYSVHNASLVPTFEAGDDPLPESARNVVTTAGNVLK